MFSDRAKQSREERIHAAAGRLPMRSGLIGALIYNCVMTVVFGGASWALLTWMSLL